MKNAIAVLVVCCLSAAGQAAVVNYANPAGLDFRIVSIEGLALGSETYDVYFVHGGSYDDLEASLASVPDSPITFNTYNAAEFAADAIVTAINALNTDADPYVNVPAFIIVPYGARQINNTDFVDTARSTRVSRDPLIMSTAISSVSINQSLAYESTGVSFLGEWAIFVPEPTSAALLSVLSCCCLRRKRRMRRASGKIRW